MFFWFKNCLPTFRFCTFSVCVFCSPKRHSLGFLPVGTPHPKSWPRPCPGFAGFALSFGWNKHKIGDKEVLGTYITYHSIYGCYISRHTLYEYALYVNNFEKADFKKTDAGIHRSATLGFTFRTPFTNELNHGHVLKAKGGSFVLRLAWTCDGSMGCHSSNSNLCYVDKIDIKSDRT